MSNLKEAYPGDDYLVRCKAAVRNNYSWLLVCIVGMIAGACADFANLFQVINTMLNFSEETLSIYKSIPIIYFIMKYLAVILAVALTIGYIVAAGLAGNQFRLYRSTNNKSQLFIFIFVMIVVLGLLVIITFVRISEIKDATSPGEAMNIILIAFLLSFAMLIGTISSFYFGYMNKHPLAEVINTDANRNIGNDASWYKDCKSEYIKNNFNRKKMTDEINELDSKTRLFYKKSQEARIKLMMIKNDPGEARDVIDFAEKAEKKLSNLTRNNYETN